MPIDSITLTERLILLNLGVRWDSNHSVKGVNIGRDPVGNGVWTIDPLIPATPTGTPGVVQLPKQTWEFTNYQVGLVFKPTRVFSSVYMRPTSTSSTPPLHFGAATRTPRAARARSTGNLANDGSGSGRHRKLSRSAPRPICPERPSRPVGLSAFHLTQ